MNKASKGSNKLAYYEGLIRDDNGVYTCGFANNLEQNTTYIIEMCECTKDWVQLGVKVSQIWLCKSIRFGDGYCIINSVEDQAFGISKEANRYVMCWLSWIVR